MTYQDEKEQFGKPNWVTDWTTLNEINFLTNLEPSFSQMTRGITRYDLLKRYLLSMPKRVNWGEIDKDLVRSHVEILLYGNP